MASTDYRTEADSMGELAVPVAALWGAQTQRAVQNFRLSGWTMPRGFIRALGLIKSAAAVANRDLGLLDAALAEAIVAGADEVAAGRHDGEFPVDVFQTGSGTSSNMNANEVIAKLAATYCGRSVHANDHVNMCQSSNDVIPTAIHLSAALALREDLLPALASLARAITAREREFGTIVKTGRTHLMDAMPLTLAQELSAWRTQIESGQARLRSCEPRLLAFAIGGTAVGTGINAHADFGRRVCDALARRTGLPCAPNPNYFEALAAQDTAVELSGQLKVVAVTIMKISNDLRWMNSGPLAGLGEIELPALQPGSSIMPGKVNPVIPEATAMIAAQVIGYDAAISVAGLSGSFQLNVMLPLIAYDLLTSIALLARAAHALADQAIAGFKVKRDQLKAALERNAVLVTALNPIVGYDQAAAIAAQAHAEGVPVLEVAQRVTGLPRAELLTLLDPLALTQGGLKGGARGAGG